LAAFTAPSNGDYQLEIAAQTALWVPDLAPPLGCGLATVRSNAATHRTEAHGRALSLNRLAAGCALAVSTGGSASLGTRLDDRGHSDTVNCSDAFVRTVNGQRIAARVEERPATMVAATGAVWIGHPDWL
jgi:hypothetical protein